MLQAREDQVLQGSEGQVLQGHHLLRSSRSGSLRDGLCSGPVPSPDGELLQAGRDLLRRQDELLLGSDELLWFRGSGCWSRRSGSSGEGSSSATEGRSRSGSEGLMALRRDCDDKEIGLTLPGSARFFLRRR